MSDNDVEEYSEEEASYDGLNNAKNLGIKTDIDLQDRIEFEGSGSLGCCFYKNLANKA